MNYPKLTWKCLPFIFEESQNLLVCFLEILLVIWIWKKNFGSNKILQTNVSLQKELWICLNSSNLLCWLASTLKLYIRSNMQSKYANDKILHQQQFVQWGKKLIYNYRNSCNCTFIFAFIQKDYGSVAKSLWWWPLHIKLMPLVQLAKRLWSIYALFFLHIHLSIRWTLLKKL